MSQVPQPTKQKRGNELRNAPRFPQGKIVLAHSIPKLSRSVVLSEASVEKLTWAKEQVSKALRATQYDRVAIAVTNFDANPTTMKAWLERACKDMFPSGNRHLSFQFRGSRRNGILYVQMMYGRKPSKGQEITQRV